MDLKVSEDLLCFLNVFLFLRILLLCIRTVKCFAFVWLLKESNKGEEFILSGERKAWHPFGCLKSRGKNFEFSFCFGFRESKMDMFMLF